VADLKRSAKKMKRLLLSLLFITGLGAARDVPIWESLVAYSARLTQATQKKSDGVISDDEFCGIAAKLLAYLDGEPRRDETPQVRILKGADDQNKIIISAGYFRKTGGPKYYYFTFIKKSGALESAFSYSYE
jgi:hypothetical protein